LAVGDHERVLVTDHRLLPLSWTRDAYYQALLLLALGHGQTVAEHLRWLWGPGRPTTGGWQRSHLPDGLLAGEENPADDPSGLPFALSTQILYWYAAARPATVVPELGLDPHPYAAQARTPPCLITRHFTVAGPYGEQWAYESDCATERRLHQDANDLPTGFAPRLGFCRPDDELWRATMRFTFSEHNPGYVPGHYGGLGSAHTPGTWTLGEAQELAVAEALGDQARAEAVRARLKRVVGVDGLLPETYHPETGQWLTRHWFAWPAAVLGALHLRGIRRAVAPRGRDAE
jgi:hypothetical protein